MERKGIVGMVGRKDTGGMVGSKGTGGMEELKGTRASVVRVGTVGWDGG